jgi:hypothetical protein
LIIEDIEDWLLADEDFGSTAKAYGQRSFTNGKCSTISFQSGRRFGKKTIYASQFRFVRFFVSLTVGSAAVKLC